MGLIKPDRLEEKARVKAANVTNSQALIVLTVEMLNREYINRLV